MVSVSLLLWIAIALFVLGIAVKSYATELSAVAWVIFGFYWLGMSPYFWNEPSIIKTVLSIAALPICLYVAYVLVTREVYALVKLGQAVAAMGLIYLPFAMYGPLNSWIIEHTATQSYRAMSFVGVNVDLVARDGLDKRFVVTNPSTGEEFSTHLILACTGIGSMAIFGGLIAAIDAPMRNKLLAFSVSVPVIYLLNIIRNVFIATAYGYQWFPYMGGTIEAFFGKYEGYASFFWADKVLAQSGSVIALVIIALAVIKVMPEAMDLVDELLDLIESESNAIRDSEPEPQ